jgi:hypothetical protein
MSLVLSPWEYRRLSERLPVPVSDASGFQGLRASKIGYESTTSLSHPWARSPIHASMFLIVISIFSDLLQRASVGGNSFMGVSNSPKVLGGEAF